jgi:D-alanine transaminase
MPRYSYVNGAFVPHNEAFVHVEDRGYQFADGIYEVIGVIDGIFADERGHLDRLERSLNELQIPMPVRRETLRFLLRELLRKNRIKNAALYIQITRGTAKRDFKFPVPTVMPTLVLICWPFNFDNNPSVNNGVQVITVPDQRWERRDIKTIALLPQVLAKQKAAQAGAYEALMVDQDGMITEGSSSNFWILKGQTLKTRYSNTNILKGVTRTAIAKIAAENNLRIIEEAFTPDEAYQADEAFCTSATALLVPVIGIDGNVIGSGRPGEIALKIYRAYREYAKGHYDEQNIWSA